MTIIYHNPRCSKSRQTLQLLEDNNIQADVVKYLESPLNAAQLQQLLSELDFKSARELMRTKEDIYKELQLASVTDEMALIDAIANNPKLMERPVVSHNGNAKVGRPPESVLELF